MKAGMIFKVLSLIIATFLFFIPPAFFHYFNIKEYFYYLHGFFSVVGIISWVIVVEREGNWKYRGVPILIFLFWYIYLFKLFLKTLWSNLPTDFELDFKQPNFKTKRKVKKLLQQALKKSEENKQKFIEMENYDSQDLNKFYQETLRPAINESIETRLKFSEYLKSSVDWSKTEVKGVSLYAFESYYASKNYYINYPQDANEPYIGKDVRYLFGEDPPEYSIRSDINEFIGKQVEVKKIKANWGGSCDTSFYKIL